MAKKYSTNRLEPDFPEKAKAQAAAAGEYAPPPKTPFSTAEFPTRPTSVTEEETRRFGEDDFKAYSFQGGQVPAAYQPTAMSQDMGEASERKVQGIGIAEKWVVGLPYLPVWIGLVMGIILLLVTPKEENKVRFHAAQGFAAQVAIGIVSAMLGIIGNITDTNFGSSIFGAFTTVMMIIFAVKAFRGKPVHIEVLDDLTNWFEDKIGPIKDR
jgi:uncharacterized membrane protein